MPLSDSPDAAGFPDQAFPPRTRPRRCWMRDGWMRAGRQSDQKSAVPVFHGGIAPLESKGRGVVAAIDVPIECAGVRVESGDLVAGDADGIVVIPRKIEKKVLRSREERI